MKIKSAETIELEEGDNVEMLYDVLADRTWDHQVLIVDNKLHIVSK